MTPSASWKPEGRGGIGFGTRFNAFFLGRYSSPNVSSFVALKKEVF